MKELTNFILPIRIDFDLNQVESIKFVFVQHHCKRMLFEYPSDNAFRKTDDDNIICLRWTAKQTTAFNPGKLFMDTLITVVDSQENPKTDIVELNMDKSLFEPEEVLDGD